MKTSIKNILKIMFISFPVLIVIAGLSFFLGILVSAPENAKYMTVLIGGFAAIFAFVGVAYSKNEERKLKENEAKLIKLEEYFINLFELIQSFAKSIYLAHDLCSEMERGSDVDKQEKLLTQRDEIGDRISSLRAKDATDRWIYAHYLNRRESLQEITEMFNDLHSMLINIDIYNYDKEGDIGKAELLLGKIHDKYLSIISSY